MPHWMTHADHGVAPAYDSNEMSRMQSDGWKFLNTGDGPNVSKQYPLGIPAEKPAIEPAPEPPKPAEEEDILSLPVVQIIPQLVGMSKGDLEAIRAREGQGKARKGLLTLLADEIEKR